MAKRERSQRAHRSKGGFSEQGRAQISTGITIGTGIAMACLTVWVLYWISTESMRMMLDALRAFGIY